MSDEYTRKLGAEERTELAGEFFKLFKEKGISIQEAMDILGLAVLTLAKLSGQAMTLETDNLILKVSSKERLQ